MQLGFSLPIAGAWASPENVALVARRAEEAGYASVWTFQRLLYATEPENPYPPIGPGPWPSAFRRVLDSVVSLTIAALATSRVRIGAAVLVAPYVSPLVLATQLATLDLASGGRLDVGLGLGWSEDEFRAVGIPFERRGARFDEYLRCLIALWGEDPVRFDGEFYVVPEAEVQPKPVQRPHPPVLIGGYGPTAIERTVQVGDGFIGGNVPLDDVAPLVAGIREAADRSERDPDTLCIVCRVNTRLHASPSGSGRRPLWGSESEIRQDIGRYREAGLTELFLEVNLDPAIADPGGNPGAALSRGVEVLETFAPDR